MLKIGSTDINKGCIGDEEINKAYLGNDIVFDSKVFTSIWETTTPNETITLPTPTNYRVNWGDGTTTTDTNTHIYSFAGLYKIRISGFVNDFSFNDLGDKSKIKEITKFGNLLLVSDFVKGCDNLNITATDIPLFDNDSNDLFNGTTSLIFNQSVNNWDVSNVNIFRSCFSNSIFNQDISNWDVSNVQNLENFVSFNTQFNQPLNTWDTISLTSCFSAFNGCSSFNQDLSNWNVSNCTSFASLFLGAISFNGDISTWNVSQVTLFNNLFNNAQSFNGNLNSWVTTSLTNLTQTFRDAASFNKPLDNWDVSNVSSFAFCFRNALSFNQDISSWDFSSATNLNGFMQFKGSEYDPVYLSNLYIKLDNDLVFSNMISPLLIFGTINYTSSGLAARTSLINKGFIIVDGGLI